MLSINHREYVFNLFKDFVELRTHGYNRDDAWNITVTSDPDLTEEEKKALLDFSGTGIRPLGEKPAPILFIPNIPHSMLQRQLFRELRKTLKLLRTLMPLLFS